MGPRTAAVAGDKVVSARWLVRAALLLVLAAAADLVGFADLASLAMVGVGAVGVCLMLVGGYWFLARRGVLRWLALGVVKGYSVEGTELPYTTTFAGAFERAEKQGHREPFVLPQRWLEGKDKLDLKTPFNFVSTADTIGGNSGSPVLNRAGELVGINFDRNRHGLVRNFVYTDMQARHISVQSRAVLEALRVLYGAEGLVKELLGK